MSSYNILKNMIVLAEKKTNSKADRNANEQTTAANYL